jgi:transposase-like protein
MENHELAAQPTFVRQMTLAEFDTLFPDEQACWNYLLLRRWPSGPRCPRCNNEHVYESTARPWHWQCKHCGKNNRSPYRFSLKTKTIFEETKKPLRTWFRVLHLMLTSKKGISAHQIYRLIGSGTYETAWYMCMRLRAGMKDPEFRQLMGIVEVDETFIGGKEANKHKDKRNPRNRGGKGKVEVIGAMSRKGSVVCQMIEEIGGHTTILSREPYRAMSVSLPRMNRLITGT